MRSLLITLLLAALAIVGGYAVLWLRRLPNWLTLGATAIAVLIHALLSGPSGLIFALVGTLAGMAVMLPLAITGLAGPGDTKVAGAIGALVGWQALGWVGLSSVAVAVLVVVAQTRLVGITRIVQWTATLAGTVQAGGLHTAYTPARTRGHISVGLVLLGGSLVYTVVNLIRM